MGEVARGALLVWLLVGLEAVALPTPAVRKDSLRPTARVTSTTGIVATGLIPLDTGVLERLIQERVTQVVRMGIVDLIQAAGVEASLPIKDWLRVFANMVRPSADAATRGEVLLYAVVRLGLVAGFEALMKGVEPGCKEQLRWNTFYEALASSTDVRKLGFTEQTGTVDSSCVALFQMAAPRVDIVSRFLSLKSELASATTWEALATSKFKEEFPRATADDVARKVLASFPLTPAERKTLDDYKVRCKVAAPDASCGTDATAACLLVIRQSYEQLSSTLTFSPAFLATLPPALAACKADVPKDALSFELPPELAELMPLLDGLRARKVSRDQLLVALKLAQGLLTRALAPVDNATCKKLEAEACWHKQQLENAESVLQHVAERSRPAVTAVVDALRFASEASAKDAKACTGFPELAELSAVFVDAFAASFKEDQRAPLQLKVDAAALTSSLLTTFVDKRNPGVYFRATIGVGYAAHFETNRYRPMDGSFRTSDLTPVFYEELGVGYRFRVTSAVLTGPHVMTSGLLLNVVPNSPVAGVLVAGGWSANVYGLLDVSTYFGCQWVSGLAFPAFGIGLQLPLADYLKALTTSTTVDVTATSAK